MKNLSAIFLAALLSTACSSLYQQIVTVASDNIFPEENGLLIHEENGIAVTYDFWDENGAMSFLVTNTNNEDIILDMTHSFYICEGIAYDYCSYSLTEDESPAGLPLSISGRRSVIIPGNCSRAFIMYEICNTPYRECGLARNPRTKETAEKSFDSQNTPLSFENRLTFMIGDEQFKINDAFYIMNVRNVNEKIATVWTRQTDCDGNMSLISAPKFKAGNTFYINYVPSTSDRNNYHETKEVGSPIFPLFK